MNSLLRTHRQFCLQEPFLGLRLLVDPSWPRKQSCHLPSHISIGTAVAISLGVRKEKIMRVQNVDVPQRAVHSLNYERQPVSSGSDSRYYSVRSSLGTFTVFSFMDALYLAKQIFTVPGCWALINFVRGQTRKTASLGHVH
jgi:hypothetical protein